MGRLSRPPGLRAVAACALALTLLAPPALARDHDDDDSRPGNAHVGPAKDRDKKNGAAEEATTTTTTTTTTITTTTEARGAGAPAGRTKKPPPGGVAKTQPAAKTQTPSRNARVEPSQKTSPKAGATQTESASNAPALQGAAPSADAGTPVPTAPADPVAAGDRTYYEAYRGSTRLGSPGDALDNFNFLPSRRRGATTPPRTQPPAATVEAPRVDAEAAPAPETAPKKTNKSGVRGAVAEVRAKAGGLLSSTGFGLSAIALLGAVLLVGGLALRRAAISR